MTYCLAIDVEDGLVFASDSRTNAGADQLGLHSKMHRFAKRGERLLVLLSAGNLATTQGVVARLERDIKNNAPVNLMNVEDLHAAAEYVGGVSSDEQQKYRAKGTDEEFVPEATFILGGQVRGVDAGIELIYPEGNFVRASQAAPFLQIGEVKYGKPILDRLITRKTTLDAAVKCALVSMDSTMHSNANVGPPLECLGYRTDSLSAGRHRVFAEDDEYLLRLRRAWSDNIRTAFDNLPKVPAAPAAEATANVARLG